MVRQFRICKLFKRRGRYSLPGGAASTSAGELALPCRACPQPQVNLPDGWEKASPDKA
jgi:hypothetical protein